MSNDPALKTQRWRKLCEQIKRETAPVCWWCGKGIDLSLSGRDPMGWSADHIKPRWSHPELTFAKSNIRPAHMIHNSDRAGKAQTGKATRRYG